MSLAQPRWTHSTPPGRNPAWRAHLDKEADAAATMSALANRRGDLDRAHRWEAALDLLEELVLEAGPDDGALVTECADCDTIDDVERMQEGHDGLLRCSGCHEEAHCPCCLALDADDPDLAYLIATADLNDDQAAELGVTIPRERA